ncbi:MAG: hypothetical protein DRQ46_00460 [Gammaproteobacteria bacterium]|nr:MAG: hypothetical protein DRQ46_00460 [Gammaproteobacteria bacterium]
MAYDWSATTLSTLESIAAIETEINLRSPSGEDVTLADEIDIASATNPLAGCVGISVTGSQGAVTLAVTAASEIKIADGHSLTVTFRDCATLTGSYEEIFPGMIVYYKRASGADVTIDADTLFASFVVPDSCQDYIKPYITSSASNTGTITIASEQTWLSKITTAKLMIGNMIQQMLPELIGGYTGSTPEYGLEYMRVIDQDGGDVLDIIANASVFDLASDLLTLSLIYEDLIEVPEDVMTRKSEMYHKRFMDAFANARKIINLDIDRDGDVDKYRAKSTPMLRRI